MAVSQSSIFMNNRSQSVRLPKSVAFPDSVKKVEVVALKGGLLITPVGKSWDSWFDGPGVTPDFMTDRDQPADQSRDAL